MLELIRKAIFQRSGWRRDRTEKRSGELCFWQEEIKQYVRWMKADLDDLYGVKPPEKSEIVEAAGPELSAILTWVKKDGDKYLRHLNVSKQIFEGSTVLEIGCGPLPYALCFENCQIIGLDPLAELYQQAGYPLLAYDPRIRYLSSPAETIPLLSGSVDAVVSVNAIDHVDDFWQACREIDRVLRKDGTLILEVHYHRSRVLEPWQLDDDIVRTALRKRPMVKISDRAFTDFYPKLRPSFNERLTVWTNQPHLFQ